MGKPLLSLGEYRITYTNKVVQTKHLITHESYINIVKPLYTQIDQAARNKDEKEERRAKLELKELVGEFFFTDNSPIYDAHKTGILEAYGGPQPCEVIKIS